MVRDEDFGEVPNLGPARDALDQPPIRGASRAVTPSPLPSSSPAVTAARPHSGHGFIYLLLLLLVFSVAGFGYWSFERQLKLEGQLAMQVQQQQVSAQKIAALENLISATDENANKSGAALDAQLRKLLKDNQTRVEHVDSELAKLWTVAHQRNRPKLEELDKVVAVIKQQLQTADKQLAAADKQLAALSKEQKRAGQQLAEVNAALKQSDQVLTHTGDTLSKLNIVQAQMQEDTARLLEQLRIRDQANQELNALQDGQLKQLGRGLAELQQRPQLPATLADEVKEYGRAIDSINAFRKQINQELLRLRERVNALQLSAPVAAPKAPAS